MGSTPKPKVPKPLPPPTKADAAKALAPTVTRRKGDAFSFLSTIQSTGVDAGTGLSSLLGG